MGVTNRFKNGSGATFYMWDMKYVARSKVWFVTIFLNLIVSYDAVKVELAYYIVIKELVYHCRRNIACRFRK